MNLTHSLNYLAIAVAMVSSFATQAHAQTLESVAACEAFTSAVAEIEGAVVVSGLEAEETFPRFGVDGELVAYSFLFDTPQITIPSGTIVSDLSDPPELFLQNLLYRQVNSFNVIGDDTVFGLATGLGFVDFVPDPELGTFIGIAIEANLVVVFNRLAAYDGDTRLNGLFPVDGEPDLLSDEISAFLVEPGQNVTNVRFLAQGVSNLKAAYISNPPEDAESIIASVNDSLIDLGDPNDKDVRQSIRSLEKAQEQTDQQCNKKN